MQRLTACGLAMIAALALATGAVGARPPGKAPRVRGVTVAPPPAWAEAGSRARWLAFGSYCWSTACVDMLPPANRPDLPVLRLSAQGSVRIHLAFRPSSLSVRIVRGAKLGPLLKLPARAVVDWHPVQAGLAIIEARGPHGSTSYLMRLTPRSIA